MLFTRLFPEAPRDTDTSAIYAGRAHAYWSARADETGDPDDVTAARAWERRWEALQERYDSRAETFDPQD